MSNPDISLDFRLVRKTLPDGSRALALNLGRETLETSIFLFKEDLEFLLGSKDFKLGDKD